jgi:plastocyanin
MALTKIKNISIDPSFRITGSQIADTFDLTARTVSVAAPTQNSHPSTKEYVDTSLANYSTTLGIQADTGTASTVNLKTQSLQISGTASEIETSVSGQVITIGLPSTINADISSAGTSTFASVDINGGNIDGTIIGAASAAAVTGTTITASSGFSGNLTGNVTGNVTGTVSDISNHTTDNLSEGTTNKYFSNTLARGAISVTDAGGDGSLSYDSSTGVITYTGPSATEVRAHISVTDVSGDGSLSYDSSTGVITYTGPSASEVRAHFTAGTGVSISSGQISIGQAVATTDSVTFAAVTTTGNVTIGGNLTVNGTTTSVNSTTVDIADLNITLAKGALDSAAANGAGITIDGAGATITYVSATDTFDFNKGITANVTGTVSDISNHTTDNLTEGSTNLYYTNARAILAAIPAVTQLVVTTPVFNYNIDQYSGDNPTIYVNAGETISFDLNQGASHPFAIRVSNGGSNYNTGLTHIATDGTTSTGSSAQGKVSGKLFWKIPYSLAGNTYVYQCTNHSSMVGNIVIQKPISLLSTSDVTEGTTNKYFSNTLARGAISVTDVSGDGSLSYDSSTGVITYTGPSASEVRTHISVTDVSGDGSLSYDSSTGVITYTGPSASEVRAHFTAGTGVSISSGQISIGQAVATTDNVTFATVTTNLLGDVYASDGISKILENGTDGTNATFTGAVTGTVSSLSNHTLGSISDVNTTGIANDKILRYDSATSKWIMADMMSFTMRRQQFTATGSSNVFTLNDAPASREYLFVTVSGIPQRSTTYTVSGTTLTLGGTPNSGEIVEVIDFTTGVAQQITDTDVVPEGSVNLYYTNSKVKSLLGNLDASIIPSADNTYDLGSSTYKWRDLYLGGNTIYIGSALIKQESSKVSFKNSAGDLYTLEANISSTSNIDGGTF